MTKAEKRRFIRELTQNVTKRILANVDRMPGEWDGHELRRYIADRFDDAAITMRPGEVFYRARLRRYRNDCLVSGLD